MSSLNAATLTWLNDLTAQGILTTDTELRIRGWNRWLEQHSGHSAAAVLGRPLLEVYPELTSRRLAQAYYQALDGQIVVLAQRLHRYLLPIPSPTESSPFSWMQQSAQIAPLTADGQIIGTITVIEDVTERELRERELQRRIAVLEGLYDVSRAILSLDLPQCLQQIVNTTVSLVPAPLVAVVLRREQRLRLEACSCDPAEVDEERLNSPRSVAAAVVRSGQPIYITDVAAEGHLPLSEQSRSVMAAPLLAHGAVIGALMIESPTANLLTHGDQSQILMLAAQAAIGIHNVQLYEKAKDAIQIRDTFLSIASHELKTPLTTMLGHTQLMQRRLARADGFSKRDQLSLDTIANQANRLDRMLTSLLDLSRLQSGQLNIQRAPLDLGPLIQRVIGELGPLLDKRELQLRLPDEALLVDGDELRLEQVLQNLLQNAVKYSPAGAAIRVEAFTQDELACVCVIDEGVGIAAHEIPRLFDRFYRAGNAQAQHVSGFGVGLYIVRQIVELHGGQIKVESEEGRGSTFTICLPLSSDPGPRGRAVPLP
jgi:PAS domain S-box-containing protein